MSQFIATINAVERNLHGRAATRRLRHTDMVPAIIYGANVAAVAIAVSHKQMSQNLKHEIFHASVLTIIITGNTSEQVILRSFKLHPVTSKVMHLDFQRVSATDEITMKVPLRFFGEQFSPAVKEQGAHITKVVTEVEIRAIASQLPSHIDVDLSSLTAGKAIHLSHIVAPAGVSFEQLLRGNDDSIVIAGEIADTLSDTTMTPTDITIIKEKTPKTK